MARATKASPTPPPAAPASGPHPIPAPPDRILTIDALLEYWRTLLPEYEPRVSAYLYRLFPIIQREPSYIDKLAAPPDEASVFLRQWGAGKYKLMLVDNGRRNGGICEARFEYSENFADYPPVLEPLELDQGRKENRSYIEWLRSKGQLKMPDATPTAAPNDGTAVNMLGGLVRELLADIRTSRQAGSNPQDAYNRIADLFASANKSVVDMVLSQVKQSSPQEFMELMTAYHKLQPAPATAGNPSMEYLMLELREERKTNRDLMLKMLERQNEKSSGLGQVKELVETVALMKEAFGGNTNRDSWVGDLLQHGPQILSEARQILFGISALPPRKAPISAPTAAAPAATNAPPVVDTPTEEQMFYQAAIRQIGAALLNFVANGADGREFGDWLIDGYGLAAFGQVKKLGQEKLIALIKGEPQLWEQLSPLEAQLNVFIGQFLSWQPNWQEEEPAEPPATRVA